MHLQTGIGAMAASGGVEQVPIVFPTHNDAVGTGHVQSLVHPGGNITDVSTLATELNAKQLQLLASCCRRTPRKVEGPRMFGIHRLACGIYFDDTGIVDENQVVVALAALAQPVRLKVFRALVVVGQAGLTPGAMAEGLAIPPNTLSFHLKELTNAGLAVQERAGRNIVYRAAYERMNTLLGYLTENCCQGAACAVGPVNAACNC